MKPTAGAKLGALGWGLTASAALGLVGCGGLASESSAASEPLCSHTIQLVVDTSSSMSYTALANELARPPVHSRWDLTQAALIETLAFLPSTWSVGLTFFPNISTEQTQEACIVSEQAAPISTLDAQQRAFLAARLMAMQTPRGATPTADALQFATSSLRTVQSDSDAERFIVLLTDGAPTYGLNCESGNHGNEALLAALRQNATEFGVRTLVIGLPGSGQAQQFLSRMSSAAGTASPDCSDDGPNYCHVNLAERADDLSAAIGEALVGLCPAG